MSVRKGPRKNFDKAISTEYRYIWISAIIENDGGRGKWAIWLSRQADYSVKLLENNLQT